MSDRRVFPFLSDRRDSRIRLFCLPHAGGSAALFRGWSSSVPTDVEVRPIELPGRGARYREPSFTSMEPLIASLVEALSPLRDKPFAFYGHSLGGIVAFELARTLVRDHQMCPAILFVTAARAAHLPNPNPELHALSDEDFLTALRRYNGIPQAVLECRELLDLMLPMVRADFTLFESYRFRPGPPLPCPIAAFGGVSDPWVRRERMLPWGQLTDGGFSLSMLPGDHFFPSQEEAMLLGTISSRLRDVPRWAA
jgi:medium-chain acyl-[acyl-carrier-protein] hydrolase